MTMKAKTTIMAALLAFGLSFNASAKDRKEEQKEKAKVTFLVSMTCESCQKRIEDNIAFEKGVTGLNVDLPQKTVTIEYRKDKTSPDKLKAAISELGYTATPFKAGKPEKSNDTEKQHSQNCKTTQN